MNILDLPDDILKKINKLVHKENAISRKLTRKANKRLNKELKIKADRRKDILSNWWRFYNLLQDKKQLDEYSNKIDNHHKYCKILLKTIINDTNILKDIRDNIYDIISVVGGDYPHLEIYYIKDNMYKMIIYK